MKSAFCTGLRAIWRAPSLALVTALVMGVAVHASTVEFAEVRPETSIRFPDDEGAHPSFRTEWWYVTGWLEDGSGEPLGFQVTFFRARPGVDEENPSRFAAKQLLFAHAALSDPRRGSLLRAEKGAREGFGLAHAAQGKLDVRIDDWTLRAATDGYTATVAGENFSFDLQMTMTQPPLLQGAAGFSQKGPDPNLSSHYYSLPQLRTVARVRIEGRERTLQGRAWFDHEWSSTILGERAQGWDWAGINLHDGGALTLWRMRDAAGAEYWASGTSRTGDRREVYDREQIEWTELRRWRSGRTGVSYPVEWRVRYGTRQLVLRPLFDDQENDARASTGTIYWEGAVRALDEAGSEVGRGYLELTGYDRAIRF